MKSLVPPSNGCSLHSSMHSALSARQQSSSLRTLTTTSKSTTDFSSNDFLSLATSKIFKEAFAAELSSNSDQPIGSRGSRLLDGNSTYAEALESNIASFHNAPAGLLFNSGFDANAGFFSCVPQKGDVIVHDDYIHASVHEGMRLSRASKTIAFQHNCTTSLKTVLESLVETDLGIAKGAKNFFVAVESLYSMDGDLAPLRDIVSVVEGCLPNGNGHIIVDEAHSTGVYGPGGRGVVSSLGLEKRIFARLHTFGKGMGCNGAIILCDALTRRYLINYARPLIYTTFMSFPSLAAIKASYSLLETNAIEAKRFHLFNLITHLYTALQTLPSTPLVTNPLEKPESPIFALLSPEPRSLAKWCQDAGFMVRPIVAPTVPVGTERVRVCLHAGNTVDEVDRLVKRIGEWIEVHGEEKSEKERTEIRARL